MFEIYNRFDQLAIGWNIIKEIDRSRVGDNMVARLKLHPGFRKFYPMDADLAVDGQFNGCWQFRLTDRWGASVIRSAVSQGGTKGLFELALLDHSQNPRGMENYDTPFGHIHGNLTLDMVLKLLDRIELMDEDGFVQKRKIKC